jgi:hypothetical protein
MLLLVCSIRGTSTSPRLLWLGTLFQLLACGLSLFGRQGRALADPVCQEDGPIRHEGGLLTADAIGDLTAWTTEKGIQALRVALTLGCHYHRVMSLALDAALVEQRRPRLALVG